MISRLREKGWGDRPDAFFAGYFDADGTVGIYRKSKACENYAVKVRVTSTEPGVLIAFKARFGGCVRHDPRPAPKADAYNWEATTVESRKEFLETVAPHVVVKRDRVALALEFIETLENHAPRGRGWKALPVKLLAERVEFRNRMREMNRVGAEA